MIQRVQSVYLALAALLSVALFWFPVYSIEAAGSTAAGKIYLSGSPLLVIMNAAGGVLSMVILFLYKNRNIQVRLCNVTMLIICIFISTVFYAADHDAGLNSGVAHYQAGCYFPLVQLILVFLAMRAIRKDEQLVRSADRLR